MIQMERQTEGTPELGKILDQVYPGVWASETPGKAKNTMPVKVELTPGSGVIKMKQYPLRLEDQRGIKKHNWKILKIWFESEFNTQFY